MPLQQAMTSGRFRRLWHVIDPARLPVPVSAPPPSATAEQAVKPADDHRDHKHTPNAASNTTAAATPAPAPAPAPASDPAAASTTASPLPYVLFWFPGTGLETCIRKSEALITYDSEVAHLAKVKQEIEAAIASNAKAMAEAEKSGNLSDIGALYLEKKILTEKLAAPPQVAPKPLTELTYDTILSGECIRVPFGLSVVDNCLVSVRRIVNTVVDPATEVTRSPPIMQIVVPNTAAEPQYGRLYVAPNY